MELVVAQFVEHIQEDCNEAGDSQGQAGNVYDAEGFVLEKISPGGGDPGRYAPGYASLCREGDCG